MTASPQRKPLEQIIREQDEKLTQVSGQLDALYRREANRITRGWRNIAMGITVVGLAWIYVIQPVLVEGIQAGKSIMDNHAVKNTKDNVLGVADKDVVRGMKIANYTVGSDVGYRIHPIHGTRLFHGGIDVGMAIGTPLFAVGKPGVESVQVECGNEPGGAGIFATMKGVDPDNPNGIFMLFHMNRCNPGTYKPGESIGESGNTGGSTGPHSHKEWRKDGTRDGRVPPKVWMVHQSITGMFPQTITVTPKQN